MGSLGGRAAAGFLGGLLAARLSGRRTLLAAKEETLPAPKPRGVSCHYFFLRDAFNKGGVK